MRTGAEDTVRAESCRPKVTKSSLARICAGANRKPTGIEGKTYRFDTNHSWNLCIRSCVGCPLRISIYRFDTFQCCTHPVDYKEPGSSELKLGAALTREIAPLPTYST